VFSLVNDDLIAGHRKCVI